MVATRRQRGRLRYVRYYDSVAELPAPVRNALPSKAQRMYMHVYNSGVDRYDNPARVAWGVVAKYYERPLERGRKWTRRPGTETGKDDEDALEAEYYNFVYNLKEGKIVDDYIDDDDYVDTDTDDVTDTDEYTDADDDTDDVTDTDEYIDADDDTDTDDNDY